MKKIFLFFALLVSIGTLKAQTYKYYTDSFAYKLYQNNRWTDWSDWEDSHMLVVLNLDRNVIHIYSEEVQEYDIYNYGNEFENDYDGGQTLTLDCVNEDGLRCQVRLRIQSDGSKQLYVDFRDMMWVYGLIEH